MGAFRAAVAALESKTTYRCPGCFVGPDLVHTLECPLAPDNFLALLRAQMDEALSEAPL